jgi:hypothetical protein
LRDRAQGAVISETVKRNGQDAPRVGASMTDGALLYLDKPLQERKDAKKRSKKKHGKINNKIKQQKSNRTTLIYKRSQLANACSSHDQAVHPRRRIAPAELSRSQAARPARFLFNNALRLNVSCCRTLTAGGIDASGLSGGYFPALPGRRTTCC